MRLVRSGLAIAIGLALRLASAACGGTIANSDDAGPQQHDAMVPVTPDANSEAASRETGREIATDTNYPASHPPLPTVVSAGGPTLATPEFIPITFPGDPNQADIVAFTSAIGASTYWSTIASQYGVGPATRGAPVVLTAAEEPPGTGGTIADADVQAWLQMEIESGVLVGTNGPSTVYAVYFPSGTTITLPTESGGIAESCLQFGGYHAFFQTTDTGAHVAYVVIARCSTFPTTSGPLTGLDAITGPASHEYLEVATDPEPRSNPAYVDPDEANIFWAFAFGGGEIGDMCALFPNAFFKPAGLPYTVQRSWSNESALASHDPCQPDLTRGEVYFNSVAVLPDEVTIGGAMTRALTLDLHTSKTVEVDLYSDGPTTGPWSVQAVDVLEFQGYAAALSFRWDKTSGTNGDKLHLTVTARSNPRGGIDGFMLMSQLGPTQATMSVGLVVVK
jgi:hypothetical protein